MRLKAAALSGLALGAASVAPIALLAWLSLRPGFYAWLTLEPHVAEALVSTAAVGWPRLWGLLSWSWIDGPASLLMAGTAIGCTIAVFVWLLSQLLSLDPDSLALSSLKWSVRNAVHWRFLFLIITLFSISWALVQLSLIGEASLIGQALIDQASLIGPASMIVMLAVWGLALPWQVIQPTTVRDPWIGRWWQTRRPSARHALGMLVVWAASFAIALVPWVGAVLSATLSSAATSHLLMRSGSELNRSKLLDLFRPIRFSRWLLTALYVAAFALPWLGLAVALGVVNIFGLPVVRQLNAGAALSIPGWWVPYTVATDAIVENWWIFVAALVGPWATLVGARLAHQEIAAAR